MRVWRHLAEEGEAAAQEGNNVLERGFKAQGQRRQTSIRRRPHAHPILGLNDAISEWDVIQDVRDLNDRMAEYATQAANGLEFGKVRPPSESLKLVEEVIGPQMMKILTSVASGGCGSIGVRIALQAVFMRVLSSTLESWSSESDKDAMLQDIYKRIARHGAFEPSIFSFRPLKGGQKQRLRRYSGRHLPSATQPIFTASQET